MPESESRAQEGVRPLPNLDSAALHCNAASGGGWFAPQHHLSAPVLIRARHQCGAFISVQRKHQQRAG